MNGKKRLSFQSKNRRAPLKAQLTFLELPKVSGMYIKKFVIENSFSGKSRGKRGRAFMRYRKQAVAAALGILTSIAVPVAAEEVVSP